MRTNLTNAARSAALAAAVALTVGALAAGAKAQDHSGHAAGGQAGEMPFDLHYIDMTLMHHEHGVEMARLAEEKGRSAQVKAFARKTAADQQKETKELQRYRDTWYAGRPQMDHAQMTAHMRNMPGHGKMKMDPEADTAKLRAATGAAFDRLFLDTMTRHHQMAIEMSKEAATKAEHAELKSFARRVVTKQQAEGAEMKRIRSSLGGAAARKPASKPAARKRTTTKKPAQATHSGHNMD
jgi:uncharacterized protein (DUF305 family)